MKLQIHPSPSIVVKADTSIAECIDLMRKQNVGSVLIVKDLEPGYLVGIFTERDLLKKLPLIGTKPENWTRPIKTVMSSPVRTLPLSNLASNLDQAAELMLKFKMRHLPITGDEPNPEGQIALGVISMRDLFKFFYENQKKSNAEVSLKAQESSTERKIYLITQDTALAQFALKVIQMALKTKAKLISLQDETQGLEDILLVDLDYISAPTWAKFLKAKLKNSKIKRIILFYNPTLQTSVGIQALEKIGGSEMFVILKKPVDVFRLYESLQF